MNKTLVRSAWMAGIGLLAFSLLGASQVMNSRSAEARDGKAPAQDKVGSSPGVVCYGRVEVEPGVLQLAPLMPGEVAQVLCYEGQPVKKGDILLKMNDDTIVDKVVQAESGVRIAEAQVAQARQAIEQFPELVAQQDAAVKAAEFSLESARALLRRGEKMLKLENPMTNVDEMDSARAKVNALEASVTAERAKLRMVQKGKPDAKLEEAARNLELRRSQVQEAKHALDRASLKAPSDGTVLQVIAGVGSQFSPMTRQPAVVFVPSGPRIVRVEVDQEFAGRIAVGQPATIHDDATIGPTWQGKVVRVADAFLPRRNLGPDLLSGGAEVRPLECIVDLSPSNNPPKLGQRVRINLSAVRTASN